MAARSINLPMAMVPSKNVPVSCEACAYHHECGGLDGQQDLWGCFGGCGVDCGAAYGDCDWTCPNQPTTFIRRWREVGGWPPRLTTRELRPYQGRPELPPYMPVIYHGHRREGALPTSDVVVPMYKLLGRTRDARYGARAVDAADLRARFGLHPEARVLLLSVAQDQYLERYWRYAGSRGIPAVLAKLGIAAMTIPNFSIFTDAPRTHTLWNIARMLRVGEELSAAGVSVIPHLNAGTRRDWDLWRDLLRENTHIRYVCKEFQTGLKEPNAGRAAITAMRQLRDDLGREIHPVVVGARRFIPELTRYFSRFTLVTSTPFFRTMHRKQLAATRRTRWIDMKTAPGAPLDDLLEHNVTHYDAQMRAAIEHERAQITITPRLQTIAKQRSQSANVPRTQLSLSL